MRTLFLLLLLLLINTSAYTKDKINVVVSLLPLQSLVAMVNEGINDVDVVLGSATSPHQHENTLSYGAIKKIETADILFVSSKILESNILKSAKTEKTQIIILTEASNLVLKDFNPLSFKDQPKDEKHDHTRHDKKGKHDHAHHDKGEKHDHAHHGKGEKHDHAHHDKGEKHDHAHHGKGEKHDHAHHDKGEKHDHAHHDKEGKHDHAHHDKGEKHDHAHHGKGEKHDHAHHTKNFDYHVWLSTKNVLIMLQNIADAMIKIDKKNKNLYLKNVKKYSAKILELENHIKTELANKHTVKFMTYHNAWGYFVEEHNLAYVGSILANEDSHHLEDELSVKDVIQLTSYVKNNNIICIFTEPQFSDSIVKKLSVEHNIKIATLDPIGLDSGTVVDNYFTMMKKNTQALKYCL